MRVPAGSHSGDYRLLILLAAASFLMRCAAAVLMSPGPLDGDALQYDELGLNLARGLGFIFHGSPSALRPPAYPVFLAAIYAAVGHSLTAVRLAQAGLDACTVVVVFLMGRRFFGRPVSVGAALLVAFQPALIIGSTFILTETLYTLLLVAGVYLFLVAQETLRTRHAVAAGILFGVGILCRPTGLILPPVLLAGALACDRRAVRLKLGAVATLVAVLTVAPWTIRNAVRFGAFIPVSNSSLGGVLWLGSYVPWDLEWRGWDAPPLDQMLQGRNIARPEEAVEVERIFIREAKKNIAASPLTYAWFCVRKVWNLWRPTPGEKSQVFGSALLLWALRSYHVALIALFLAGLLLSRRVLQRDVWFYLLLICWTAMHAVTFSVPRYLLPVLPFIALYAAAGGAALVAKYLSKRNYNVGPFAEISAEPRAGESPHPAAPH